jgi:hypothetical protein
LGHGGRFQHSRGIRSGDRVGFGGYGDVRKRLYFVGTAADPDCHPKRDSNRLFDRDPDHDSDQDSYTYSYQGYADPIADSHSYGYADENGTQALTPGAAV